MSEFFRALVAWQRKHGRHGLPWQRTRDPYRVWLSEIMLQQTQVRTVLAYYDRFLNRFPDVASLASASLDDVLALWSGLGYYSRARHLHRCATEVVRRFGGQFPATASELQTLPGIGPSTAAAVAAFCHGERVSIMDGNVQRVLTRYWTYNQDLAVSASVRGLWDRAQALIPADASHDEMEAYTQGLMDLGATVCKRSRPDCGACPVQAGCLAAPAQRWREFPVKTRTLKRRTETWWMQVLRRPDGAVWLEQRPDTGIWAGLYAFPMRASADEAAVVPSDVNGPAEPQFHPAIRHSLTHRDLVLHPVEWSVRGEASGLGRWVTRCSELDVGLPAPLRVWLEGVLDR